MHKSVLFCIKAEVVLTSWDNVEEEMKRRAGNKLRAEQTTGRDNKTVVVVEVATVVFLYIIKVKKIKCRTMCTEKFRTYCPF